VAVKNDILFLFFFLNEMNVVQVSKCFSLIFSIVGDFILPLFNQKENSLRLKISFPRAPWPRQAAAQLKE